MIKILSRLVVVIAICMTLYPQPAHAFLKELLTSVARSEAERIVRNGARDVIQGAGDMVTRGNDDNKDDSYDSAYEPDIYEQQERRRAEHEGQYEQYEYVDTDVEYIDGYGVARELPAQESARYKTYQDYDEQIAALEAQKKALAAERNEAFRRRHAKQYNN
jgi:hypothetical protein